MGEGEVDREKGRERESVCEGVKEKRQDPSCGSQDYIREMTAVG